MFDISGFDGHERVNFFSDSASGLRGVVAIHSTTLGPAMGGCRAWAYADSMTALTDSLRLSRGMSYKNAIAGLPLGGGKAVIIREPGSQLDDAVFEAFGEVVQQMGGTYITAEDVGVNERNMVTVARKTAYVSGLPAASTPGAVGGDPSPKTALGVFLGMRAAVRRRLGRHDMAGVKVAVQGLGSVGRTLCQHLHDAGAQLYVADINADAVARVSSKFGATVVSTDEILFQPVDVLSPCALGGALNETSIPKIKAKVIAGAANNQLRTDRDGQALFDLDILYAPDYVINAGGIISAGLEYLKETDARVVLTRIEAIEQTVDSIFDRSARSKTPTNVIADAMARELLRASRT